MNKWLVQSHAVAGIWLRDRMQALADRAEAKTAERGQTSFEYLGIAVVIAVIIGVLAGTTDIGTSIKNSITGVIAKITAGTGK